MVARRLVVIAAFAVLGDDLMRDIIIVGIPLCHWETFCIHLDVFPLITPFGVDRVAVGGGCGFSSSGANNMAEERRGGTAVVNDAEAGLASAGAAGDGGEAEGVVADSAWGTRRCGAVGFLTIICGERVITISAVYAPLLYHGVGRVAPLL